MKRFKILSALILSVAALVFGNSASAIMQETRGVWMWSSEVKTKDMAQPLVDKLMKHNMNMIILLVKGNAGTACWDSKINLHPATNFDVVKAVSDACNNANEAAKAAGKQNRIDLHLWFVFHGDGFWVNDHPAETIYHCGDATDSEIHKDTKGGRVCPLKLDYRNYVLSMINEVISNPNYKIAGIHLDYIRYPMMTFCFCPEHQAIAREKGIDLDKIRDAVKKTLYDTNKDPNYYFNQYKAGDPDITKWVQLRQDEINSVIDDVKSLVKKEHPELKLSAAFMPEGAETDDAFGLCHYAQNYSTAGSKLDFICPMSYPTEYPGKTTDWPADIALKAAAKSGKTIFAGAGIGQMDQGFASGASVAEIITKCREKGIHGFVLFKYGNMKDDMWIDLDKVLSEPAVPYYGE